MFTKDSAKKQEKSQRKNQSACANMIQIATNKPGKNTTKNPQQEKAPKRYLRIKEEKKPN